MYLDTDHQSDAGGAAGAPRPGPRPDRSRRVVDGARVLRVAERAARRIAGRSDGLWFDDVIQAALVAAWTAAERGADDAEVWIRARAAAVYELKTLTQARHRHGSVTASLDAPVGDDGVLGDLIVGDDDEGAPLVDLRAVTGPERRVLWAVATSPTHQAAARRLGMSPGRVSQLVRSALHHAHVA